MVKRSGKLAFVLFSFLFAIGANAARCPHLEGQYQCEDGSTLILLEEEIPTGGRYYLTREVEKNVGHEYQADGVLRWVEDYTKLGVKYSQVTRVSFCQNSAVYFREEAFFKDLADLKRQGLASQFRRLSRATDGSLLLGKRTIETSGHEIAPGYPKFKREHITVCARDNEALRF